MKQGSFALGGLCCPVRRHYYDPLRLPLGCRTFPGVAGYSQARSTPPQGAGRGGSPQFPRRPCLRSTLLAPGGSWAPDPGSLVPSMAFALKARARLPLGPGFPGECIDAASFASCCGPQTCSTPLRRKPLDRRRGFHYRGPWRLPGPDSHRLALVSLALRFVRSSGSLLLSWRPSCWAHASIIRPTLC